MYHILVFLLLFAVWMVFSGQFDAFHLSMGALSALLVTLFSGDLFFEDRRIGLLSRARTTVLFPMYGLWLLWRIARSNLHVLYLALHPRGIEAVDPGIVRIRTNLKSDFEKVVLANSITLTPGTIALKIDGDSIYVHVISRAAAASLDGQMERRLAELFGGEAEVENGG